MAAGYPAVFFVFVEVEVIEVISTLAPRRASELHGHSATIFSSYERKRSPFPWRPEQPHLTNQTPK